MIVAAFGIILVVLRTWPPSGQGLVSTRRFVAVFAVFVVVRLALGFFGPKLISWLYQAGFGRLFEAWDGWLLPLVFLAVFLASSCLGGVAHHRACVPFLGPNYLYDRVNPVQELWGGAPTGNLLSGGEVFMRPDAGGAMNFLTAARAGHVDCDALAATPQHPGHRRRWAVRVYGLAHGLIRSHSPECVRQIRSTGRE